MAEFEDVQDDAPRANVAGVALPRAAWALVRDGVVMRIVHTYDHVTHPFGRIVRGEVSLDHGPVALTGEHVIRVDGSDAAVGHLVDAKGNTTPAEGRTRPLVPGEAAYQGPHAAQVAPAASVAADEPVEPSVDPVVPREG